jgi:hypothetical protein
MRQLILLALATVLFAAGEARAQWPAQPDLLSAGVGLFDALPSSEREEAIDFRAEYRWGLSLLPLTSPYFASWDPYFQIHPSVGVETSSRGQLYGFYGFVFDVPIGPHLVISPQESAGLYYGGDGKRLGSFVEFRSQFEAGWRFDNEVRLTGFICHESNAKLTTSNHGEETIGVYLHLPTSLFFGG